jgi:hypothetical protein
MSPNRLPLLLFSGAITLSLTTYTIIGSSDNAVLQENAKNGVSSQNADETIKALECYQYAEKALNNAKTDDALRFIEQARGYRMAVTRNPNVSARVNDISASSLLLRLCRSICAGARQSAGNDDPTRARTLLRAAESLAEHVLETPTPTLQALQTGRALDLIVHRTEVAVLGHLGDSSWANRVVRQEAALKEFYAIHIMPPIISATQRRERATALSNPAEALRECDRADDSLALVLLAQYSRERLRLLRS